MSKRALIIVDVQPTFCEGGELPVEGGNAVAHSCASYVTEKGDNYDLIVTSQDWHIDPTDHFSETPDFVNSWPAHGVADSPSAELHPAIANLPIDITIKKGQHTAAYSAFDGTDESGQSLAYLLAKANITDVDLCGLALSHCVLETALDAKSLAYNVRVLYDLSAPVSQELGEKAKRRMEAAHIELITSTEL